MPRKLDQKIADILRQYGYGPDACWDCHNVWVVYHRVLEGIAAQAGIKFEMPMILEADGKQQLAALCVRGSLGDKSEWSIGEAAPKNNKNPYPYAMAEKRAKDRVVLKLIGLHGLAYSEDEADDFKPPKDAKDHRWQGPLTKAELQDRMIKFDRDLLACTDEDMLEGLLHGYEPELSQIQHDIPAWWTGEGLRGEGIRDRIAKKRVDLT